MKMMMMMAVVVVSKCLFMLREKISQAVHHLARYIPARYVSCACTVS